MILAGGCLLSLLVWVPLIVNRTPILSAMQRGGVASASELGALEHICAVAQIGALQPQDIVPSGP